MLGGGLAVVGSAGAIDLPWLHAKGQSAPAAQTAAALPAAEPLPALQPGNAPNYRAIVQRYGPSVVGILVEGKRSASDDEAEALQALPRGWRPAVPPGAQPFRGQGSGFIVAADGLILTNAHVVKDAQTVTVLLADRREYTAKVLGSDAATDIAVLRIPVQGLQPVRLGDPAQLAVGDPVLAIGAPYGLAQTATAGIVSATGRSLPGDGAVPFIQTDAAVNPGNSGGPLFDAAGNVVGINAQIYSRTGGYQGVSFAIPVDVAMRVSKQIVATGSAQHARLGVAVQDMTQPLADSFGLARPDGALVSQVAPGSPAAAAGLQAGDVIQRIDGQPTVQAGALSARIAQAVPGDRIALGIWRQGKAVDLTVTLGRAGDGAQAGAPANGAGDEAAAGGARLGLALRPLQPEERAQAKLDRGLLVQGAQGAAARAGLSRGDVVLAINGQPVDSVETLQRVLAAKPKRVALLVWRAGEQLFVPVAPV
ncbi:serine protease [Rubrivivax pictus]|uniref:Serine protease n=2 Tax=Pseudaquabacterium pictum TaxID=2315236 RepID=A0A480AUE4_9BURK|nr:serine protease [Rubrivivax pictus]